MASYPLAALAIRPSTFNPVGVLETATAMQGQQTQNQLAGLRMAEMQEQMRETRDRRGALEAFRTQGGMANPAALTTLSGHPDIYTQAAGAMNTRQRDQVLRNAQAAREVMLSTREGTPERAQAFQRELDRALQEGRIDQDTHQRYASQPASNLFLQNLVSLATPITDKLSTRELFGMFGFGPDGAESAATAPPVRPQAAAGPMPFAPSAPIATGRVALSPNAAVTPPAQAPADVPGVLVDNTTAPTTTAPMPAFAPDTAGAAPPATPAAGPPPRLSLRELVARGTDAQRESIKLLLATGKLDDVAKILREIEGTDRPPPTGFERDPNRTGGLRPIPGGPGEHVPSETAGRLGFIDTAMRRLPTIRQTFERAWSSGDVWRNLLAGGADTSGTRDIPAWSGAIGQARRDVRMLIEGALRAQTGAAAPEEEVARYTAMFMPGATDSIESARAKIDALEEFANRYRNLALAGRTAPENRAPPPPTATTPAPSGQGAYRVLGVR